MNLPRRDALFASVISILANVGMSSVSGRATMHCCMYGVRYSRWWPVLSGPSYRHDNVFPMHDSLNDR